MRIRSLSIVAAAAALIAGGAAQTQAAEAYAYSRQDINNLSITMVEGDFTTNRDSVTSRSTTSVLLDPPGFPEGADGDTDFTDAERAYASDNGATPPGENDESAFGEQSFDFSRSDSAIDPGAIGPGEGTGSRVDLLGVAESFLTDPIDGNSEAATADGNFRFGTEFTVGENGGMFNVSLDYDNAIEVRLEDPEDRLKEGSLASGSFNFNLSIVNTETDAEMVFDPRELNATRTVTTPGELPARGAGALEETFELDAGTYRLSVSGGSSTATSLTVIPTPAALPGGLMLLGVVAMRRRRRRQAA